MNLISRRHWRAILKLVKLVKLVNHVKRLWTWAWTRAWARHHDPRVTSSVTSSATSNARRRSTAAQHAGDLAENRALAHLQKSGLRLLTRNYRCRYGEIDLIMQAQQTIVFVEVRARSRNTFGGAAASVTWAKQKRLWRTAQHYLSTQRLQAACRFDVVAFEGEALIWLTDTIRL